MTSGERIRRFIERKDPYGRIATLDRWRNIFGDHWNSTAELQALAHIEKIEISRRATMKVPVRGTYSQFYVLQVVTRKGHRYTVARDSKTGRFVKQIQLS